MRQFKKQALALEKLIRELDVDGTGVSAPQLRRNTGWSRAVIAWALGWLEDVGAVEVHLDADKRKLWSVLPEEPDEVGLGESEPVDVFESLIGDADGDYLMSSLTQPG
jgi:hypothetical protein